MREATPPMTPFDHEIVAHLLGWMDKAGYRVCDLLRENHRLRKKRRNQRHAYRSLQRAYTELLRVHGDLRRSKPMVVYQGGFGAPIDPTMAGENVKVVSVEGGQLKVEGLPHAYSDSPDIPNPVLDPTGYARRTAENTAAEIEREAAGDDIVGDEGDWPYTTDLTRPHSKPNANLSDPEPPPAHIPLKDLHHEES